MKTKYKYKKLSKIQEGTIFSISGTYGKPYLRLGETIVDMSNGNPLVTIPKKRLRMVEESIYIRKHDKSPSWLGAWKDHVIQIAKKKMLKVNYIKN